VKGYLFAKPHPKDAAGFTREAVWVEGNVFEVSFLDAKDRRIVADAMVSGEPGRVLTGVPGAISVAR
jgi:hypothetical protein